MGWIGSWCSPGRDKEDSLYNSSPKILWPKCHVHISVWITSTEVQYAQIEKELLAIVFGLKPTCMEGKCWSILIINLWIEAIFKKSLLNAPKRLQRMLLRLQRFEFEVSYRKGTSVLMAYPLSRACLSLKEATEDQEDVRRVSKIRSPTEIEAEQANMLQYLPVKGETLGQIRNLTQQLKKMLSSRPALESSNKVGQKESSISHWKFKTTFHSKDNWHFKMELFSKETVSSYRFKWELSSKESYTPAIWE